MTIDPARYDGHTPGPWDVSKASWDECDNVRYSLEGNGCSKSADARLIADAPMLLDKVLELQAEIERLAEECERQRCIAHCETEKLEELGMESADTKDRLEAENTRLRSLIPAWVTVTEDPETLPKVLKPVLLQFANPSVMGGRVVAFYKRDWWCDYIDEIAEVSPGDRWCYVPTPRYNPNTNQSNGDVIMDKDCVAIILETADTNTISKYGPEPTDALSGVWAAWEARRQDEVRELLTEIFCTFRDMGYRAKMEV